jgi:hypothetical protein
MLRAMRVAETGRRPRGPHPAACRRARPPTSRGVGTRAESLGTVRAEPGRRPVPGGMSRSRRAIIDTGALRHGRRGRLARGPRQMGWRRDRPARAPEDAGSGAGPARDDWCGPSCHVYGPPAISTRRLPGGSPRPRRDQARVPSEPMSAPMPRGRFSDSPGASMLASSRSSAAAGVPPSCPTSATHARLARGRGRSTPRAGRPGQETQG